MKKMFHKLGALSLMATAVATAIYPVGVVAAAAARAFDLMHGWVTAPRQSYALGANVLTPLIPTLYEALNVVSRELVGFIPAVRRDSNAERAAVNQTVRVPMAGAGDMEDIVPGVNPANTGDTTPDYVDIAITKAKAVPVRWNGEEQLAVNTSGVTYNVLLADQLKDAMRKLTNAVEVDLAIAAKNGSSRAYGTPGTTPFGVAADLSDFAQMLRILEDNGAPTSDLQMVFGSAAMANLRGKQSVLFRVNEAGSNDMLRNGMTDRIQSFALRNSAGVAMHTNGTGASYVSSGATAAGIRDMALVTGTGTVLAGDVVTFAGDAANKYVVNNGVAAPGAIKLGYPGARVVIPTSNAMTVGNSYTPTMAFDRNAMVLAARAPALPAGGDSADDSMMLTDPVSGITFEVRVYRQYRQVKIEVCLAWGVAAIKGAHIATLLG